jgi:DNA-directed RNA polymerase specialized sigma24 family protein
MSASGSVTHWIQLLRSGDDSAAREIWHRYKERLIGLARKKLGSGRYFLSSPEDIVVSVFDSVFRGIKEGRFPRMEGRDDLWKVLVTVTARKSLRVIRQELGPTAGGGRVVSETDLPQIDGDEEGAALDRVIGREPSPEFAAQVVDECRRLLALLGKDDLQRIACWKMEEYTNAEIAAKLGCIERTVERKVQMIRAIWEKS